MSISVSDRWIRNLRCSDLIGLSFSIAALIIDFRMANKLDKLEKFLLFLFVIPTLIVNNFILKHYSSDGSIVQSLFNVCLISLIILNIRTFYETLQRSLKIRKEIKSNSYNFIRNPILTLQIVYIIISILLFYYFFSFNLIEQRNSVNRVTIYTLLFSYFYKKYLNHEKISEKFETVCFLLVFCIVIAAYLISILSYRVWTYGDDQQFLCNILSGKFMPMLTLKNSGRFYPFGFVEYNWVKYFVNYKNDVIFIWLSIKFLFSIAVITYTMNLILKIYFNLRIKDFISVCLIGLSIYLCSPETLKIFNSAIYIESTIIISMLLSIAFYVKAKEGNNIFFYVLSTVFVIYSLYLKETVILFYIVFSITNIIFRRSRFDSYEKIYFNVIILNILLFMLLYYLVVFREVDIFYNQGRSFNSSRWDLISKQLKLNPIFGLLYTFAIFRVYDIFIKKNRKLILLDSILAGCVVYSISFILLNLCENYMFAPSYALISILFLSYTMHYYKLRLPEKSLIHFILIFLIIIFSYHTSQYNFSEIKKSHIDKKDQEYYTKLILNKLNEGYKIKFIVTEQNKKFHTVIINHWQAEVINRFLAYFRYGNCDSVDIVEKINGLSACSGKNIYLIPNEECDYITKLCANNLNLGTFFGISMYESIYE